MFAIESRVDDLEAARKLEGRVADGRLIIESQGCDVSETYDQQRSVRLRWTGDPRLFPFEHLETNSEV